MKVTKDNIIRLCFSVFFVYMSVYFYFDNEKSKIISKSTHSSDNFSVSSRQYLTETRKIDFNERVNMSDEKIIVKWWLWYDGDIISSGQSKSLSVDDVRDYEETMMDWANDKIHLITQIKKR